MRDGVHSVQERPRKVRNEYADEVDAPCQDNSLGGQLDRQEDEGRVETNLSGANIVDGAKYDGRHRGYAGNCGNVETDATRQDREPGGQPGDQVELGRVESNWRRVIMLDTEDDGKWTVQQAHHAAT